MGAGLLHGGGSQAGLGGFGGGGGAWFGLTFDFCLSAWQSWWSLGSLAAWWGWSCVWLSWSGLGLCPGFNIGGLTFILKFLS